ncbi:MAG: MotA/TolQ/ExbB proton channel family protein [Gammaproteobacteria bacterium]|nr:MotA/TolQ/ExbB proton channel family protein [Gammaproteobacteria bacterium]NND54591.1 MotA/TolQ/ExbB proton channel family protein [Gammaproteobacteria bacterium]
MDWLTTPITAVRDFMELGGPVLTVIAVTIFAMWVLIIERLLFFRTGLNKLAESSIERWQERADRESWYARQARDKLLSRFSMAANSGVSVIQTLVALCPLLGLLGTVTGMILVFDVMAISGTGNARSMAAGVSQATIPTMAGMVGALSGVFLTTMITRMIERRVEGLEEELYLDH